MPKEQTPTPTPILSKSTAVVSRARSESGAATNNTVNVGGTASLASVSGGARGSGTGNIFDGNTLNKNSEDSTIIGTAENFENVAFGYSGRANIGVLDTGSDYNKTVLLDTKDNNVIFNGSLSGDGWVAKNGKGTLTLSGVVSGLTSDSGFLAKEGRTILEGYNISHVSGGGLLNTYVYVDHGAEFELQGDAFVKVVDLANRFNTDKPGTLIVNTTGNENVGDRAVIGDLDAMDGATVRFVIDNPNNYGSNNPVLEILNGAYVDDETKVEIFSTAPLSPDVLENLAVEGTSGGGAGTPVTWNTDGFYAQSGFFTEYRPDGGSYRTQATEQSKAVSEGFLGGIGLLGLGGDLINDKGIVSAVSGVARSGGAGEAFAAIGGGQIKHKTGSHVDVSGKTLVAGFAAGIGSATVGAFLEYGDGDYDSHNSFSGGKVRGSGDTDYFGAGLLGRYEFATASGNKPYLEATARFGRLDNDFKTDDFQSAFATRASFDTKSNYYGLSFGGGHIWKLGADSAVDVYGRYVWTRQAGDSVTVAPSDERVKFSAVDSHRVRVGARYSQGWGGSNQAYVGVAVEYEFDGEANAKVNGLKIDAPDLEGSTGIAEVGIVFIPTGNKGLTIDLGLQGYGGQRKGATGSAQLKYAF